MKDAFSIFIGIGGPIIIVLMSAWIMKCTKEELEKRRRELHPEYFEHFDAAMDIVNEVHDLSKHKKTYFEYHLKLIYEGLQEGECTAEYFQKYTDRINKEYIEFAAWFDAKNKEAKDLFRKADFYAKERDLKWGILY